MTKYLKSIESAEFFEAYAKNKTQHSKLKRTKAFKIAQKIRAANKTADFTLIN